MEKFSCWKLSNTKTLDEYIDELKKLEEIIIDVEWDDAPLKNILFNLNTEEKFKKYDFELDEDIKYIFFGVKIERAKRKDKWYYTNNVLKPREERVNIIENKILIYGKDNDINIIIFNTDKSSSVIMNTIFKDKEVWGRRERKYTNINDDMFYWLFKRFRSYNEERLSTNSDLFISGLEGYMAKTREDRNVFRGVGHRIGAMLGTLAFLLNDSELRSLKPELQHNNHIFKIEITSSNSYTILDNGYEGNLNYIFRDKENEKLSNIIIYIDLYIIPKLIQAYNENIDMNLWSKQFKLDFLKDIGEEISERVSNEIDKIQKDIDELDDCQEQDECEGDLDYQMDYEDMIDSLR